MSIIQSIRDKAAWIIIGAIALALIAFIVQDAFQNQNLFGDSAPTSLGTVNGKDISASEFDSRYKMAEEQYRNAGYPLDDRMRENIRESLWNEYVENALMQDKYEDLGIQVSERELSDILFGPNPPQDLRQQFTDPNTGVYDANAAYQQIQALRKQKNSPMYESFFNQYLPAIRRNRQKEKYISMLSNSIYVPKWLVEKTNNDNSLKASISFVNIPYSTISDSAVKVSDEEVKEYVKEREEIYKQERARGIEYVMFDASATRQDSSSIYDQLVSLKSEFAATTDDPQTFLVRQGSETAFLDGYTLKSKMQMSNADSIQNLEEGEVLGPYIDEGSYVLAKMIDKRSMPDSVKVRHILIKTADQGRPVLEDSIAKKRIDSIADAVQSGRARFDSMVVKYSDDAGSKDKQGEYDFSSIQFGNLSKEFAETAFYGKAGDKKIVKVDNASYGGYHYIEVLSQKNFEPAYKVAYLTKAIVPSDATDNAAMGLASQFAAESRTKKQFEENARKQNLNRFTAVDIKPLESMIVGLGSSRELVRWMYEAEVGDVAEMPYKVGDKYVVPILTHAYEEGPMAVERARSLVELYIRNEKKAEQIKGKIGSASTLEQVSKVTGHPITNNDSILFNSAFIPNIGQETKVIGAAFHKPFQSKPSPPIAGNGGVFVLKTNSIGAVSNPTTVEQQQESMLQMQRGSFANPGIVLEILKKSADIKDNRHYFF